MTPLDERSAIKVLVGWLSSGHTYMPRFAPGDWWENDLCAVTKAGYWVEFEVKMSREDFLRDKAKDRKVYDRDDVGLIKRVENKHELLATTERGPARFYYAVKEGVATAEDMPPWAGLLVFEWKTYSYDTDGTKGYWQVREMVKAPRRHKRKDMDLVNQMYRAAWFRAIGTLL